MAAAGEPQAGGSPWDPYNQKIQGGYQKFLGRTASEDELRLHHGGNPNGWADDSLFNTAMGNIENSDEAKAYRDRSRVPNVVDKAPPPPSVVYDSDGVTPRRGPLGGGAAAQATAAPAPQFQAAAAGGMSAPASSSVKTPGITDEVTALLRKRLTDLSNPLDLSQDPVYQGQVRAAQVASLRGADRERAALAERAAADGTRSSGGFNVGVQGILENQRESDRGFAANLAGDRLSSREQQLMQAISMARSVGQDDIANQLELQRLDLQQELGRGDLSLRGELGRGQLRLGEGQLGLGYDNLGLNYADMIQRANRDAVLAAL